MTDAQLVSLWMMFLIGVFPLLPLFAHGEEMQRFWRIAIPVWSIFWTAPPLLLLWIRGVFG